MTVDGSSDKQRGKVKELLGDVLNLSGGVPSDHAIYYLPTVLEVFGPKICTLWRCATEKQRIMIYSLPPLLPVCQTAWLIFAMQRVSERSLGGIAGRIEDSGFSYLGNVGLVDLDSLKKQSGGWVATTSDAIFKDRPQLYDLLIDLSDVRLPLLSPNHTAAIPLSSPTLYRTLLKPRPSLKTMSYAFSDLPLYRDLRAASTSSSTESSSQMLERAGSFSSISSLLRSTNSLVSSTWLWLFAYGAYEAICEVCWGVCKLATGRLYLDGEVHRHDSSMGRFEEGSIRLEEDEREDEGEPLLVKQEVVDTLARTLRRSLAIMDVFSRRAKGGSYDAVTDMEGLDLEDAMPVDTNTPVMASPLAPGTPSRQGRIALGLEKMQELMDHLPGIKIPTIHIAGTNGKGSVTAMLTSCLTAAGLRTGTYNSPHLVEVRDSILVGGQPISSETYAHRRALVEKVAKNWNLDVSPFEMTTATAFMAFALAEPALDILVIECGMGGLRDATNVLPSLNQICAVLTPVDLDHQAFLGNTVEEIAADKLGILVEGGTLVVGKQEHAAVTRVVEKFGKKMGANVVFVEDAEVVKDAQAPTRTPKGASPPPLTRLRVPLPSGSYIEATSPLPGQHQNDNLVTALTILDVIRSSKDVLARVPALSKLTDDEVRTGLAATVWRGRCDWVELPLQMTNGKSIRVLVDGAHNTLAATRLRSYIDEVLVDTDLPVTFIVGMSHSPPKTAKDVLWPLLAPNDRVIGVSFTTPIEGMPWIKSVPFEEVKFAAVACGLDEDKVDECESLSTALTRAVAEMEDDGLVVVTGSLYLVADLYRLTSA